MKVVGSGQGLASSAVILCTYASYMNMHRYQGLWKFLSDFDNMRMFVYVSDHKMLF